MTNSILSKISSNYHFEINKSLGTKKKKPTTMKILQWINCRLFYVYAKPCCIHICSWNCWKILVTIIMSNCPQKCSFVLLYLLKLLVQDCNTQTSLKILGHVSLMHYRWQSRQPVSNQTDVSFTLLFLAISCDWWTTMQLWRVSHLLKISIFHNRIDV